MSLKIENKLTQKSLLQQIEVKNRLMTHAEIRYQKNIINHLARMNHRKLLEYVKRGIQMRQTVLSTTFDRIPDFCHISKIIKLDSCNNYKLLTTQDNS